MSVKENLPSPVAVANEWRADAYFESVSAQLQDEDYKSYTIWANFNSPSEPFESIAVKLLTDGSTTVEPFTQPNPVPQDTPISDGDWILDSGEALEAALDDEGRQFLDEHVGAQCSSITLERSNSAADPRVVWTLLLAECANPLSAQITVIDAATGQLIRRESHLNP